MEGLGMPPPPMLAGVVGKVNSRVALHVMHVPLLVLLKPRGFVACRWLSTWGLRLLFVFALWLVYQLGKSKRKAPCCILVQKQ
eukprot:scaffold141424_cov15-Tisochrysis_lutea.AAC.1